MRKVLGMLLLAVAMLFVCSYSYDSSEKEIVVRSSSKGIQFANMSFEAAKAEAKSTGKLIFIDAYASWCGPCKMMDKNTFSDEEVGNVFNKKFINLKIDMEKSEEGPSLARMFQVTAYPTFLWVNGDGKIVKREMGYRTPEQFLGLIANL